MMMMMMNNVKCTIVSSAYFSVILGTLCGLGNLECALENLKIWSTFDNFETLNSPLSCLTIIPNTSSL